ncbi:hypothetical protein [Nocardia sp. NPDC051981]|uniref:hypothetical protein n=1 Tax=Nocardia sp. NPDC051981 TaxID=3155417 RepID=UPI0034267BE3
MCLLRRRPVDTRVGPLAVVLAKSPPGHRFFEGLGADSSQMPRVAGRQRFLRSLIEAALERGVAAGSVRPDIRIPATIDLVIAAMDGLESQWLLDADVDMVGSFTLFTAWLRTSVKPVS